MIADLHTHSTASDGQYRPGELVRLARARGLELLALTDHDTVDGLAEAEEAAAAAGLRVLRGVELGAAEYSHLHILGYGFDPAGLVPLCQKLKAGRDERKYRILDFLGEKGLALTLAEVEAIAGGDIIARPHFAQAMVRRGYVGSNREAFDRYLDTEEFRRKVKRFKADAETCIETIRSAGGRASLAHPYQIGLEDGPLEELVRRLAGYGLDAIECYYPRHTPAQERFYLHLAEKYGLHITGGSDFHGERVKPEIQLAALPLETDWLLEAPQNRVP